MHITALVAMTEPLEVVGREFQFKTEAFKYKLLRLYSLLNTDSLISKTVQHRSFLFKENWCYLAGTPKPAKSTK